VRNTRFVGTKVCVGQWSMVHGPSTLPYPLIRYFEEIIKYHFSPHAQHISVHIEFLCIAILRTYRVIRDGVLSIDGQDERK